MNLSATEAGLESDDSKDNSDAQFVNMEDAGYVTREQKEKVTKYIQIIGDIFQDQGEFQRTMEVFGEDLQMHMAMSVLHQLAYLELSKK